jgi:hypothetical protein
MRTLSIQDRLASVAAGALILYGCAAHPVDVDLNERGAIAARPGRPGVVIAAPHGTSDPRTGDIAAELARRTGFGLVVATGFGSHSDDPQAPERRSPVNRPSEGVPGRPGNEEFPTDDARRVYEAYEERVRVAAQGPLVFYAEIHGNNRRETAGRIEVATVGVTPDDALRLRTLLELIREAHLRRQANAPRLEVRVEPADAVADTASGAKRVGVLRLPERALHIELPRAARTEWQEVYTAILADFLSQAVALPTRK